MLQLHQIHKQFANGFIALQDIDLQVTAGEIVSLVGTSGCGKSTLLRIMAGLELPTSGQVLIHHEPINTPHPEIGIIFQEPRLMPWLNVYQNIGFGLEQIPQPQKNALVDTFLERVGLTPFADALPRQLSGGMAQRVAIARALVTQPSILLLDEPFSALDAFIRMKLQDHLLAIWEYDRPTMILVTHDIEEALVLSDRIIVLRGDPGHIHQEFQISLPRPRHRTHAQLQHQKEEILAALNFSLDRRSLTEIPVQI